MPLQSQSKEKIDATLQALTSDPKGVPGVSFIVVTKDGEELYKNSTGVRSLAEPSVPMTTDTILFMASCTKLVTAIASMQLVEQGLATLDDPDLVTKFVPELAHPQILLECTGETTKMRPATKRITLRMLLNHTSGHIYGFVNNKMLAYQNLHKVQLETTGHVNDAWYSQPLNSEPGDQFNYGTALDFAGLLLHRITGKTLGEWTKEFIFDPLNLKDTHFGGEKVLDKTRLSGLHLKNPDGTLRAIPHRDSIHDASFHSGGAGLVSTAQDYIQILRCILCDGVAPSGGRILKKESVDLIFTNSLTPEATATLEKRLLTMTEQVPWYPSYPGIKKSFGLSVLINETEMSTGRGEGSGHWAGAANLVWTIDRKNGITTFMTAQLFPFGDPQMFEAWRTVEAEIYHGIGVNATGGSKM